MKVCDLLALSNRVGSFRFDPKLTLKYYGVLGRLVQGRELEELEWDFLRLRFASSLFALRKILQRRLVRVEATLGHQQIEQAKEVGDGYAQAEWLEAQCFRPAGLRETAGGSCSGFRRSGDGGLCRSLPE